MYSSFDDCIRTVLDIWNKTEPDGIEDCAADAIQYKSAAFIFSANLLSFKLSQSDLLKSWVEVHHWGWNKPESSGLKLSDHADQAYVANWVIPPLQEVMQTRQPKAWTVQTHVNDELQLIDRIILPQKCTRSKPTWAIALAKLRIAMPSMQNAPVLSASETHVLSLLIRGLTPKEIAYQLARNPRTIEYRIRDLKEKFGASSIQQLVVLALAACMSKTGGMSTTII